MGGVRYRGGNQGRRWVGLRKRLGGDGLGSSGDADGGGDDGPGDAGVVDRWGANDRGGGSGVSGDGGGSVGRDRGDSHGCHEGFSYVGGDAGGGSVNL